MSDCQWNYLNGTTINYNLTETDSNHCICVASFPADPDIAGPGVLTSFVTTAWLTCLIAAVGAYCSLCQTFSEHLDQNGPTNSSSQFENFVDRFSPSKASPLRRRPSSITHRILRSPSFEQRFSGFFRRCISFILGLFRHPKPRMQRFARLTLDNLCSLQLVIGTAVLISATVQLNTMTYYHQQIVMNYWFLNLSSFWAARAGDLSRSENNRDWRYLTRTFLLFCSSVLSIYFQLVAIPRRLLHWDPIKSGNCFLYHDSLSWVHSFIWIGGLILYSAHLFVILVSGIWSSGEDATWLERISAQCQAKEQIYRAKYIAKKRTILEIYSAARMTDTHPYNQTQPTRTSSNTLIQTSFNKAIHIVIGTFFNIPLIIWYLLLKYLALIAWGDSKSTLLVLGYFAFAAGSTYSIFDLKMSNRGLLRDSEGSWGFGQVLPVVLLGLIGLNVLDAAKEAQRVVGSGECLVRYVERRVTEDSDRSERKAP